MIDDLKNKRIRTTGELLLNQIKPILNEITKDIKEKIEQVELKIKRGDKFKYNRRLINRGPRAVAR